MHWVVFVFFPLTLLVNSISGNLVLNILLSAPVLRKVSIVPISLQHCSLKISHFIFWNPKLLHSFSWTIHVSSCISGMLLSWQTKGVDP